MNLQSIYSQVITKENKVLKKKAIQMLISFLIVMLLLTILSRAADAVTMAEVHIEYSQNMPISYPIEITGTISAYDTFAVFVDEDLRVGSIEVKEGTMIQVGDVLFTLDLVFLEEQIKNVEEQIEKAELSLEDTQVAASYQQQQKQTSINRANEDYQDAVKSAQTVVDEAYQELLEAKGKLESYPTEPQIDWSAMETAENQLETQGEGETEAVQGEIQSGPPQEDIDAVTTKWNEEKGLLEENYKQSKSAYEQAIIAKEEAVKSASRAIEDANSSLVTNNSTKLAEMDVEDLNNILNVYNQLVGENGQIKAEKAGTVKKVNVEVGGFTSTGPAFMVVDISKGFQFIGEMTGDQAAYLREGDLVDITPAFLDNVLEDLSVGIIQYLPEDSGSYQISVNIPESLVEKEGTGTLQVTKQSDAYPNCVPLEALHTEEGDVYILAVEESTTVLGIHNVIVKIPVTVLEKNNTYAAVEGIFNSRQKIVIKSNKPLETGDRVRLVKD